MKKAIFFILFLTISLTLSAQYRVTRQAVGSGGFITTTQDINGKTKIACAGIFGQSITGRSSINVGNTTRNIYLGFWAPPFVYVGIEDNYLSTDRGIYNHPNPVSDFTNFYFNLKEPAYVTIKVYNAIGSIIANVINNELLSEGDQTVLWNLNNFSLEGNLPSSGAFTYEMIVVPAFAASSSKTANFRNILMISK